MIRKPRVLPMLAILGLIALGITAVALSRGWKETRLELTRSMQAERKARSALERTRAGYAVARENSERYRALYLETRKNTAPYKTAWQNAEGVRFRAAGDDPELAHLDAGHLGALEPFRRSVSEMLGKANSHASDALPALGHWIYLRQELQSVNCPTSVYLGAIEGIRNVDLALKDRGIRLLFCPVPTKWEIHPEGLVGEGTADFDLNPQRTVFLARLREAGVWVVDLAPELRRALAEGRLKGAFFLQDTHWTPEAIALSAEVLAARVRDEMSPGTQGFAEMRYHRRTGEGTHRGDLAAMLETSAPAREGLLSHRETYAYGEIPNYESVPSAIVVSGTSFSVIDPTGIGKPTGLPPHLAYFLRTPVEHHAGGALNLRSTMHRNPSFLVGKRLIVWLLPGREFWDSPESFTPARLPGNLFGAETAQAPQAPIDETVRTVTAASEEILPGRLIYKDLVSAFRAERTGEAPRVYYYLSVRDRVRLVERFVREGDRLRFRAVPWEEQTEKHPEFGKMNIDDPLSEVTDDLYFVTEWLDGPKREE